MKVLCDLHPMANLKEVPAASYIMDLIRQKRSASQIANLQGQTVRTIVDCVTTLIKCGHEVLKADLRQLADISDDIFLQIADVLPTNNSLLTIYLRRIKKRLPDNISYDQIQLVLAYHQVRFHLNRFGIIFTDPDATEHPPTFIGDTSKNDTTADLHLENVVNIPTPATSTPSSGSLDNDDDDVLFQQIDLENEILMPKAECYLEPTDLEEQLCRDVDELEYIQPIICKVGVTETVLSKPSIRSKYELDSVNMNDKAVRPPSAVLKRKLPSWFQTEKTVSKVHPFRERNNIL